LFGSALSPFLKIMWKRSEFHKVQWLHFTCEVNKFIMFWSEVSSGFYVLKLLKSVYFWLSYLKKIKVTSLFWNTAWYSADWATKVGCCIAGCNFVNCGTFWRIPLLECLLIFQKDAFYQLTVNCSMQLTTLRTCLWTILLCINFQCTLMYTVVQKTDPPYHSCK